MVLLLLVLVLVKLFFIVKRTIIDKRADLSDFLLIFVGKMCVFVSRPMKIVTSEKP